MKRLHFLTLAAYPVFAGICSIGEDADFVSDLNGTGDATVSVHEGDVSTHGADAVLQNGAQPAKAAPAAQPKPAAPDAEPAKALSLRDQISSALKGETDTPPAASQDGRVRNPDGTFAPKPADVAPVAEPAAAAAPPMAAPAGLDPEVFKSLPAETQASLARTMDGLAQGQQRIARLEPIEQLIAPRRDAWALNGMTEQQALTQLLALSDFAGRDLPGFIQYMAKNGGLNLEDLVLGQEPVDPKYEALQKQIADLQGARASDTQQQRQAAHRQTVDGVAAFASEKGPDNQPLRPHFGELGTDILPFISAVKAANPTWSHTQVLQDAYDRACWGSPSVRAKMQASADAAGEAARLRQGAAKIEAARTASASVRSGVPTSAPAAPDNPSRSLRDTIRESMAATS